MHASATAPCSTSTTLHPPILQCALCEPGTIVCSTQKWFDAKYKMFDVTISSEAYIFFKRKIDTDAAFAMQAQQHRGRVPGPGTRCTTQIYSTGNAYGSNLLCSKQISTFATRLHWNEIFHVGIYWHRQEANASSGVRFFSHQTGALTISVSFILVH